MPRTKKYAKKRMSRRSAKGTPTASKYGSKMYSSYARRSQIPVAHRNDITYIVPRIGTQSFAPRAQVTQHKYCQQFSVYSDSTTGLSGVEQVFKLNSLFDPDQTGTGHQPRGFDEYALIWKRYRVYKVDVNIKIVGIQTTGSWVAFRYSSSNNITYSVGSLKTQAEVMEQDNTGIMDATVVGAQMNINDLYIADVQGCTRNAVMTDMDFSAAPTANPVLTPRLGIASGNSSLTTSAEVVILVTFVFHTVWSERYQVDAS